MFRKIVFIFCVLASLGASAQSAQEMETVYNDFSKYCMSHYTADKDYLTLFAEYADSAKISTEKKDFFFVESICQILDNCCGSDVKPYVETALKHVSNVESRKKIEAARDTFFVKFGHMQPGQEAPELTFIDRDGKMHSLKEFRGRVVLVDIWGTWCKPCIEEFPHMRKLQERYKDDPRFLLMSISCDTKEEKWQEFLKNRGNEMTWQQYLISKDCHKVLDDVYYVIGIPRFILIGTDGKFINSDFLRPSDKEIVEYLEKYLK